MKALRKQDDIRLKTAARQVSAKYRERRQKLRSQRKAKGDKNAYQPGGFDVQAKPVDTKKRKRAPKKKKDNLEPKITFVMPTVEVVGKKR